MVALTFQSNMSMVISFGWVHSTCTPPNCRHSRGSCCGKRCARIGGVCTSGEARTFARELVLGIIGGAVRHRRGSTGGLSCPGCVEALGVADSVGSECRAALDGVPVAVGG